MTLYLRSGAMSNEITECNVERKIQARDFIILAKCEVCSMKLREKLLISFFNPLKTYFYQYYIWEVSS